MKLDIRSSMLLLSVAALLSGCPKKPSTDTPGAAASATAEGADEDDKADQDDKDADKDADKDDEAKDK